MKKTGLMLVAGLAGIATAFADGSISGVGAENGGSAGVSLSSTTTSDIDLYNGLLFWIKDQNSIEGDKERKTTYPLDKVFDGSFSNPLAGTAIPAKDKNDYTLSLSFKVGKLNRVNRLFKIGGHTVYLDENNILYYHTLKTDFVVDSTEQYYTLVLRVADDRRLTIYAGAKGSKLYVVWSGLITGQLTFGGALAMSAFNLGYGEKPSAGNLQSGQFANVRFWTRALTDRECECVDTRYETTLTDVQTFSLYPWKDVFVGYRIVNAHASHPMALAITAKDLATGKEIICKAVDEADLSEGYHWIRWSPLSDFGSVKTDNMQLTLRLFEKKAVLFPDYRYCETHPDKGAYPSGQYVELYHDSVYHTQEPIYQCVNIFVYGPGVLRASVPTYWALGNLHNTEILVDGKNRTTVPGPNEARDIKVNGDGVHMITIGVTGWPDNTMSGWPIDWSRIYIAFAWNGEKLVYYDTPLAALEAVNSINAPSEPFKVDTTVAKVDSSKTLEYSPFDWDPGCSVMLNGKELLSASKRGTFTWQPQKTGNNVLVWSSAGVAMTTTVNVVGLDFFVQPKANPPMPVDANISITPVTRTFEQGGDGGAIITSGSGTWTAAVSDPWIVLNATSGSAGNPVAYVVNASGVVGDRVGYVYVSGRVHTVTQHGYASTISPASAEVGSTGAEKTITIETANRITWNAKPNVDWIRLKQTSGVGSGTISYVVAPYNEVATRTGTITVGDQTFTVKQTGRRIKLSTYHEVLTDYFSHVIPVTVNALSSTQWSVTPNASWISVVDAGTGVGSDSVSLAIADNLNGVTRYGTVTIGTETLLIVQGEAIAITPETATADVNGANGFIAVGAWPEASWIATVKSNWLSILGNTAQGTGCGSVAYAVSPNPTLYKRTGVIEIAENGGNHGYPVRAHTVTQPAATATISPKGYEFEARGGMCSVTIDTANIVEWKVTGCPSWLTVTTGTTGVGPATVKLQASENNTVYPRTATLKIAEKSFAVTQGGRGVEVEYDSILFGTDGGMGAFSIHPDGNVAWNAVSSDPTWITVFQNESGTGDAAIQYIVSPYVGNSAARTGYIEVGDKKVYITQRAYDMNIDPYLATVTGDAGSGQVGISAPIGSVWEAIATEPWIKVITPTGSGSGTVTYQFTENLTGKVRTGKIIISGEEYTINQMYRVVMSVGVEGRGSVTGAGTYDYGADVTLTATPDADYSFSHWSGAASGTDNPVTIKIDEACKATAHFVPFVPTATATENELDGVTISWGALAWAEQYRVYRAEANQKPESSVATIAKGTLTWKDTTAAPGKMYYYWVEAVGGKEQTTSAAVTGMRAVSPTGLVISCVSELFAGQTANCGCTVSYNNGTTKDVTPIWSVVGSGLTVDASGVLTAGTVANDTIATVQASYTESGITKAASAQVTVYPAFDVNDAASGVGTLSTGGSGAWIGQKKESCGGATALRSTGLASGASAWIGCSVTGAGTLTFKWRKSGTGAGKLALAVNGSESAVCGEASDTWTTVTKEFYDNGTKNIRWTYFGGSNVDAHGLVAEIVWTPGTAITVNFNANGGSGTMAGMTFLEGADVALTSNAFTRTGYVFAGWATSADGEVAYLDGAAVWGMTAPVGGVVTLYAVWTPNAYTVRFAANDGEGTMADDPMTYDVAKALTACAFTRKGYTFAGWATSAGGAVKYANGAAVKNLTATAGGTVTLYAKWTPNNYVIDFNPGQGGSGSMSDQPMTYDEEAALYPNLFHRTGYTFLGWTDDESELEEVLFYDGVVVSNLTDEVDGEYDLYAVWAANEYTVRFNANGGEGAMAEMGFLYDEAQSLPMNAFTRTGYAFAGWAREAATGMSPPQLADAEVVSNLTAEADGLVTLYAQWSANPYTVRFDANGGEGEMSDMDCTYGVSKQLTFNSFTRVGYAFAGWATSAKGEVVYANGAAIKSIAASGVVTLYAKWTAISYAVKFNANGGSGSMANESMAYDAEQALAVCAFTRVGYTFAGWATSVDGEVTYADGQSVKNLTATQGATVNLYAKWTANEYVIKFNANGGSGTMADEPMTYDVTKSLTACAFMRKGYTFAGWAREAATGMSPPLLGDGAVVKNLAVSGTVTLYAKWTPNNYVVDFNPGQGGEGSMSDQPMTYDEAEALYPNLFHRTGYTFLGWTDDPNEVEEVLYYDGVVVENLTDEVDGEFDLYAIWTANEYTVRFNANGGKGVMADQAFLYDEVQNLTSNGFTRVGCEFLGWTRDAATGMSPPQLADAEVVSNLTAEADGVVTLYAVWDGTATTWMEDDSFSAAVANTYDGYMIDESCNLLGIVQVKTTKQSVKTTTDKKTKVKTVTTNITATATVTDANGKKWSYSKGVVTAEGVVTGLRCTTKGCLVPEFGVKVGKNGMEGVWGEYAIFGARNGMGTKGDAMKAALEAYKGKWSVTLSCASLTSGQETASPLVVRLQLDVQAKGVVKIAGNWENGTKVSASAQMVMGDGFAYVPMMVKSTKTSPALNALLRIDANAAATGMSPPQAVTLLSEGELVGGGRTTAAIEIVGYLAENPVKAGAAYVGRVALNELAYPAKFTQKGLPTGLKINAATGVVSGTPTKPGEYGVTFTATSSMNSKSKDTVKVTIKVDNYVDDLIPVEDCYGPYTPGVSYTETIPEAAGCTVSGLPTGMKWTAKDIKAKDGTVKTPANSVYGIPTKPGKYTVYFRKSVSEVNAKGKTVKVTHTATATFEVSGYPTITLLPSLAVAGSEPTAVVEGAALSFFVGVKQSFAINLAGTLDGVDTTVSAKGLPSGLKLVKKIIYVDPTAKKKVVDHYEYVIEGVPTKASSVDKKTKVVVPSHVKLTASNKYKWSGTFAFDIKVVALPKWAYGTFNGGNTNGMATLTVSNVGKISGKWMSEGLTWTLSAASFDAYISSEQMYVATVIGKSGKLVMTNEIEVTEGGISSPSFEAWRNGWKEEPLKTLAKNLKGQKVQVGEVLLTVGSSGAVTAKGAFVTGFDEKKQKDITYSASCSTVLIPTAEADLYRVYLYFPPKSGKFDGFSACESVMFAP